MNPAPWTNDAQNEYLAANESVPSFLETRRPYAVAFWNAQGLLMSDPRRRSLKISFLSRLLREYDIIRVTSADAFTR